jgi:hypothetical protein
VRKRLAILAVAAAAVAWPPGVVSAERWVTMTSDGYRCEETLEGSRAQGPLLGKAVCRHVSAPQRDWFVCFDQHYDARALPLRNCFGSVGTLRNDAPSLLLSLQYPGSRSMELGDGTPCLAMSESTLMKTHCWNPNAPSTEWTVCMFERAPQGVIFGDCINAQNRQWSRQLPPHLWP